MEPYRYKYFIELRLANKSLQEKESLEDYSETLYEAEKIYNQTGRRAKIKKKLEITNISKEAISVTLSSETSLTTPTLALQAFSRYVVNNKKTEHLVKNKALFRGEYVEMELENKMTDAEMIKTLVDLVLTGRKEQKQILDEIKEIILKNKERR